MAVDPGGHDPGLRAEEGDEPFERGDLPGGRGGVFEVADKADSDAVLVEEVVGPPHAEIRSRPAGTVRSLNLLLPARADVDRPVAVVHSVADDEVVPQSVRPAANPPVVFVHALGRIARRRRVVHDDDLPAFPDSPARRPLRLRRNRPWFRFLRRFGDDDLARLKHERRIGRGAELAPLRRCAAREHGQAQRREGDCSPLQFHHDTPLRRHHSRCDANYTFLRQHEKGESGNWERHLPRLPQKLCERRSLSRSWKGSRR